MVEILPVKQPAAIYAIQRRSDSLFSRGSMGPKWGKSPKTWPIGGLKNHLHLFNVHLNDLSDGSEHLYRRRLVGSDFVPDHGLLLNRFPYRDCDILTIDPSGFGINSRIDAARWTWDQVFAPLLLKERYYIKRLYDFCHRYEIEYAGLAEAWAKAQKGVDNS